MLHIYYGNGKGKTTAAVGLAVRACGSGMKTGFFQFLKNGSSSEISILNSINNLSIYCCDKCDKFTFTMNEKELAEVTIQHNEMMKKAEELIKNNDIQLIVLDEFLDAYNKNLIDREFADNLINYSISRCEVVLTGREPTEEQKKSADYLTEMKAVKHPYNNGIPARKGIEY